LKIIWLGIFRVPKSYAGIRLSLGILSVPRYFGWELRLRPERFSFSWMSRLWKAVQAYWLEKIVGNLDILKISIGRKTRLSILNLSEDEISLSYLEGLYSCLLVSFLSVFN
jgi:hypothetical protein